MVEAARIAYRDYPTVVNEIAESGMSYNNTMEDYAIMDTRMQSAQKAIGGSSDSAQLAQSYMWTKVANNQFDDEYQQLYHNTVILAVLAQVAIDGCKKVFEVDVNDDIKRIRSQACMNREKDFPEFMKYTHDIPMTKNGKERSRDDINKDKHKLAHRIDKTIVCPMNWLVDRLDKIQGSKRDNIVDTTNFFIKIPGKADPRQMSKIRKIVEDYDGYTKYLMLLINDNSDSNELYELLFIKNEETLRSLNGIKLSKYTMNRLIGSVLGIDWGVNNEYKYKESAKYVRKMLNLLYQNNKELFLSNFKKQ